MSAPPRSRRRPQRVLGSPLATELGLTLLALLAALTVFRCTYDLLGIGREGWSGAIVFTVTDYLALPFLLVPGGSTGLIGGLTVIDLTLLFLTVVVPAFFLTRRDRR